MEKLKELRTKHNVTQEQLAKILNVNRVTYSGYEKGKYQPTFETLIKLADYFNVSVDELIGHKLPKNELSNIIL